MVFAFLAFNALVSATSFTTCATDKLGVQSLTVNPEPVVVGQNVDVSISGTPKVNVSGGKVTAKVKVLGITVDSQTFDFCNDLGVSCPVSAGEALTAKVTYPVPGDAPGGVTATVEVGVADQNGSKVGCYDVKIKTTKEAGLRTTRDSEIDFLFEAWRQEHGIEFESASEYMERKAIFTQNHYTILAHENSDSDFSMAHNQFSHLTAEEFKARFNPMVKDESFLNPVFEAPEGVEIPTSVDWTTQGAVTDVKNQGQCGSCWAFSTTGSVEGAMFLKHGKLTSLSEQQLVDCDTAQDQGCNGGLMDNAFTYIKANGLDSEADYGYKGTDGTCQASSNTPAVAVGQLTGFTDVKVGDETALAAAVAQQPVSVAIEADQFAFQFYSGGVLTGRCGTRLDHGVLTVGYGTDSGKDYWKVKNSWGSRWGEKGYIRIERGTNKCGIANSASFPTVN